MFYIKSICSEKKEVYYMYYYSSPFTRYGPFLIGIITGIYMTTKTDRLIKQRVRLFFFILTEIWPPSSPSPFVTQVTRFNYITWSCSYWCYFLTVAPVAGSCRLVLQSVPYGTLSWNGLHPEGHSILPLHTTCPLSRSAQDTVDVCCFVDHCCLWGRIWR